MQIRCPCINIWLQLIYLLLQRVSCLDNFLFQLEEGQFAFCMWCNPGKIWFYLQGSLFSYFKKCSSDCSGFSFKHAGLFFRVMKTWNITNTFLLPFLMGVSILLWLNLFKFIRSFFFAGSPNSLQRVLSPAMAFRKAKAKTTPVFDLILFSPLSCFFTFWFTTVIPTTSCCNFCWPFFSVIWNCCLGFFHFLYDHFKLFLTMYFYCSICSLVLVTYWKYFSLQINYLIL